ncbi:MULTISPECIES: Gfo/Idh/MocA family protein [Paenibacillus]|uniref:Gfo/Idh/MocA family oxidoreductase n=1 Tax=Paenibacillus lignilyticus TaxID=1172615 RepID=A0ABS5CHP2_9BACL|nr:MULTISPECIES: Gfo/Idh/MocA family oxidoreductase [Paenibacillus]MBP3965348.1 Gfo/Idh/MocA family oxidoreductase [Paenibacillus lignilyticus]SFT21750.1 Predicted dehydrogenase [Paenibacillus sp. BC26]
MATRIYLIGAGFIARTHAEAAYKFYGETPTDIELKVADPNPKALASFVEQFPHAVTFSDMKDMLAEEAQEHDVVVVCTPPFTHFELSSYALKSGRHVLCEKPLVMNASEADELSKLAKDLGKLFGDCSDRFIGLPKTEQVKAIVASGQLGEIYKVSFIHRDQRGRAGIEYQPESRWFLNSKLCGGGILTDWGPYDFTVLADILKPSAVDVLGGWISKPVTGADPQDVVYDVEHNSGALMRYHAQGQDRPVLVQYERSSCTHGEAYSLVEIEGTLGAVKFSPYFGGDAVVHRFDEQGSVAEKETQVPNDNAYGFMDAPLYFFVERVLGRDSAALLNEDAVFNFKCIQAVYESAASGNIQSVKRG